MKKESGNKDFIQMEKDVLKFWQENKIFEKMKEKNKNTGKYFAFLDGPITANYPMGLHHTWNRSLKDIMLKFNAMNGCDLHYQNGFDAHGLPVELSVEKQLGLNSKKEIEKFGIANFIEECMKRVEVYSGKQTEQSIRLGQWMDWENSYYTNSDENITSIWHFLKVCAEKGWIEEKYRPTPWCTRCGTALSEHEMADADAYKEVEHTAVFFKMPVLNTNYKVVVWTTTPWTLSSNVAVAVNPNLKYSICKVKSDESLLIVGTDSLKVLKDDLISVEKEVDGKELVGLEYETCFNELEEQHFVHKIVPWDAVDATEGSCMVHIAPGCGAEDFDLGQSLGLKNIIPIDESGNFYENFGFLAGKNANEVADLVFEELKKRNKLYYTHKYKHRYPHCWRCKNPVLFRLVKNWVIKMDEIRPELIKAIDEVEFSPDFMKKRMLDWLVNMGDWSISRKRYYGIPLPFYKCPKCGKLTVVGSLEELKQLSGSDEVDKLPHLHRPYIDKIKIKCPDCGEWVERIAEVGDCWLDAGITPFSTKKYFTDKEFFNKNFPIDCVVEGKEQIRLWFYSLLVMSVALTGKAPYKKIVCTAMLLAQDGKKLSKSSPNNIPVDEAFEKIGADVIRYLFAGNNMLSDVRFGFDSTDEIRRKLLAYYNIYTFYNTYACLDNPDLENFTVKPENLNITDQWLIESVNEFIANSKINYQNMKTYLVVKDFEKLVDDISNFYIRTNRRRFWKSENIEDQTTAYYCLYKAIKCMAQVTAPILPFINEYIWGALVKETEKKEAESIFISSFPEKMVDLHFDNVVHDVDVARDVITVVQRLRNEKQIKIKQPLKTLYILASEEDNASILKLENVIKDELNIKEIVFEKDENKFNSQSLTVNFKEAGAVLKGEVNKLKEYLLNLNESEMQQKVAEFNSGKVSTPFGNLEAKLFIKINVPKPEYVVCVENGRTLVLDVTIDEELMLEGLYRELVRNIQVLRKEADFKVESRIYASFHSDSETLQKVVCKYKQKIQEEILAKEIKDTLERADIKKVVSINGEEIEIGLQEI